MSDPQDEQQTSQGPMDGPDAVNRNVQPAAKILEAAELVSLEAVRAWIVVELCKTWDVNQSFVDDRIATAEALSLAHEIMTEVYKINKDTGEARS